MALHVSQSSAVGQQAARSSLCPRVVVGSINAPRHGASVVRPQQQPCSSLIQLRGSVAVRAFAMPTLGNEKRGSLDPMASEWNSQEWISGKLLTVTSPQHFDDIVERHADKLVVLMCKSHSCRPCKMFTRKYLAIAERFPEVVCCELYGDETPDTRKMMIRLQVKVTPTFRMYRQQECVNIVTGTNDKKLMRGMLSQLFPTELVNHEREIQDTLEEEEEKTAAAAAH